MRRRKQSQFPWWAMSVVAACMVLIGLILERPHTAARLRVSSSAPASAEATRRARQLAVRHAAPKIRATSSTAPVSASTVPVAAATGPVVALSAGADSASTAADSASAAPVSVSPATAPVRPAAASAIELPRTN